jgi:hypothetical protein
MTEFLAKQLTAQGVPVRCLREDDAAHLDALAPVRESFRKGCPDAVDALLAASGNLVRESAATPRVHLVDALLPGYHYLFGLYPALRIASYNLDLYKALCSNGHYQTGQHMRTSLPLSSIGDVVSFLE